MTRSGWCGLHVPQGHVSHSRCTMADCPCSCHLAGPQTPAAEDAPGADGPGSELATSAAGHPGVGFHPDIDERTYHSDRTSLSVTGAKTILRAPALFRWQQEHPVYKSVFDFGTAAHALVLGVGAELVVHDFDTEKVKSPKATNAWKAQQAEVRKTGGVLLLPDEHATVMAMADELSSHTLAMRLLSDGQPEVSAYALDEATGVTMRGRFDWLGSQVIVDYKSCASSNPIDWSGRYGVARKFGYDLQAQWYLDLARRLGHPAKAFAWVAQEKEPPYLTTVIYAEESELADAAVRNASAREIFARCMADDRWPGYVDDTFYAEIQLNEQSWLAVSA